MLPECPGVLCWMRIIHTKSLFSEPEPRAFASDESLGCPPPWPAAARNAFAARGNVLRPHALRVVQRSRRSRVLHRFQCLCFAYVGPQGFGSCCEQLTLYLCRARSCRALVSCLDTADMARDDRGGLTVLTDAMRLVEGEDDGEEPAAAGAALFPRRQHRRLKKKQANLSGLH